MESSATPAPLLRLGIHSNSTHSNLVANHHHRTLADVIDKAVVVGERATHQRTNCATLVERLRRLRPLLDEVRDSKTAVAGAGFEGVEGAVVKAKELLERCGPEGSRVYTSLSTRRLLSKFDDVTLEIDRSLNSLPLVCLRVSDHIRSQVELVTRELRRSKYFVDSAEERLGEDLETLLREQREGSRFGAETLERVVEKLDLRSRESITQEIQALEREREESRTEEDNLEKELINRALQLVKQMEVLLEGAATEGLEIPADFRCPLSGELMSDPVIVASGQTYERIYIQHWLGEGNMRCPKTHQKLSQRNLVPNYTVKALIANWCETHNVPVPGPVELRSYSSNLQPLSPGAAARSDSDSELLSPTGTTLNPFRATGRPTTVSMRGSGRARRSSRLNNLRGSGDLEERMRSASLGGDEVEPSQSGRSPSRAVSGELEGPNSLGRSPSGHVVEHYPPLPYSHSRTGSNCSVASSVDDGPVAPVISLPAAPVDPFKVAHERYPDTPDISGHVNRAILSGTLLGNRSGISGNGNGSFSRGGSGGSGLFNEEPGSPARQPERSTFGRRGVDRDISLPRIIPDTSGADSTAQSDVERWVQDLQSSDMDAQRNAACELRMLAKHNMENRVTIANSGAIEPLVALLNSEDGKTQENAVTALLNLSINDNNKAEIARAGAIGPLVNVLRVGNAEAMENAAATLFSLSVMDDNKVTIGASGAIPPLVHLLINGSPRGKKDAATALFNLSIYHENKGRIVLAGAIRPLVELMADPAAGMVDKAVAVLANLATIPEGRQAIGEDQGIPALVEVVEAGSQRGKENAAAALLQLCTNSNRHLALVLQEGAIPPLVALSQSGTPRAKEKASALLRHFREQRHGGMGGRSNPDRHMAGHY